MKLIPSTLLPEGQPVNFEPPRYQQLSHGVYKRSKKRKRCLHLSLCNDLTLRSLRKPTTAREGHLRPPPKAEEEPAAWPMKDSTPF